jgi:hypothetical protein
VQVAATVARFTPVGEFHAQTPVVGGLKGSSLELRLSVTTMFRMPSVQARDVTGAASGVSQPRSRP